MAYADGIDRSSDALRRAALAVRRRATVGLSVVVLLVAGVLAVQLVGSHEQAGDAHVINRAGKQRMLSQRIAGAAARTVAGDPAAPGRLREATAELVAAHAALVAGDGGFGISRVPTAAQEDHFRRPGGLDDRVAAYARDVEVLLADPAVPAARAANDAIARAADGPLLEALHQAVLLDESRAEARVERVRATVLLLGVVALVVLGGAGVLLVRPLLRNMDGSAAVLDRMEGERDRRVRWQREVAGIASHELRTPVTVVAGISRMLVAHWDELDGATRHDLALRLGRTTDGLVDLLEELNVVAGLAGPSDRSLRWPVSDLAAEVTRHAGVTVELPDDCWVDLDRARTAMLVHELVENALRHGEPPVVVRATVPAGGRTLVLQVADVGPGVAPDAVEHLLSPFGRGTRIEHHSSAQGRGLGLSMAQAVVEDAGGAIAWVPAAQGGAWRVELPACVVARPDVPASDDPRPDAAELVVSGPR